MDVILFGIPHAGGASNMFKKWEGLLDPHIKLFPVELLGHGKRIYDNTMIELEDYVEDIFYQIKPMATECAYAIYGHSMGSILAYELYKKIVKSQMRLPLHIFFSGKRALHLGPRQRIVHLSNSEFLEEVKLMGGFDPAILDCPAILDYFLPILKNDFRCVECYEINPDEIKKADCAITVLAGTNEGYDLTDLLQWGEYAAQDVSFELINGGHFFPIENPMQTMMVVNQNLSSYF